MEHKKGEQYVNTYKTHMKLQGMTNTKLNFIPLLFQNNVFKKFPNSMNVGFEKHVMKTNLEYFSNLKRGIKFILSNTNTYVFLVF